MRNAIAYPEINVKLVSSHAGVKKPVYVNFGVRDCFSSECDSICQVQKTAYVLAKEIFHMASPTATENEILFCDTCVEKAVWKT